MSEPAQVIQDFTDSLRALFAKGVTDGDLPAGLNVDVAAPLSTYQPSGLPAVTVFLYRVVEDTYLRNRESHRVPVVTPSGDEDPGVFDEVPAPMGLNLNYLLIPWADTHIKEQALLGQIIRFMRGLRSVTGNQLTGYLHEQEAVLSVQLQTEKEYTLEEQTRLWDSLGHIFHLSVSYQVRGLKLEAPVGPRGRRVLERSNEYEQREPGGR